MKLQQNEAEMSNMQMSHNIKIDEIQNNMTHMANEMQVQNKTSMYSSHHENSNPDELLALLIRDLKYKLNNIGF